MRPPPVAEWLLRHLLPLDRRSGAIRGDLLEEFRRRARHSPRDSRRWYWRETLALISHGQGYRHMITLDHLRQDVRFAVRSHAKAPAFTLLVVATLALGVGASTAIFSIVNGILLRPLPLPQPDRLLWISEANNRGQMVSASWMNYLDWRARTHAFDALAATRPAEFTLTGMGRARPLTGRMVTSNFFAAAGVQPVLGRPFAAADDQPGAPGVAIVSDTFWRRTLDADPESIGRTLSLDAHPYTVVGVLPRGFRYLRDYDLFVAMGPIAGEDWIVDRGNHQGFNAVGRLKPGVTIDTAAQELRAIEADLSRTYPASNAGLSAVVEPLSARLVKSVRPTLLVLLGAVGILLLIACLNVASLLIARGSGRRHELAVRAALGGRRIRLATQLLVESSLLSLAGGTIGVALAAGLLRALVAVAPEGTPRLDEVSLDSTALLFALAAATLCGLVFGAYPAAQASGANGQQTLTRTRAAGSSAATHRLRRGLLVVEVAMALVLLAGAGLMVRTLDRLTGVEAGFRPERLLTLRLTIPEVAPDRPRRIAVMNDLVARVGALPGVETAAAGFSIPIDGSLWNSSFSAQDRPVPPSHDQLPSAAMVPISPGYFDALDAPLKRGRPFTDADGAGAAPVAIVNETLADRIWPGEDPIGKHLKQGWPERPGEWREVVGVVGDIKFEGVTLPTTMQVYLPFAQDPPADFAMLVRTAVDPASLATAVQDAVGSVNRDMPVAHLKTMEQVLEGSIARQRMARLVLGVFAAVALALASIGLFGLMAHAVVERRHEIGVRMALGAERGDVMRLVLAGGLSTAAAGAALGVAGAMAVTRSLEGLLFGVEPLDPRTFAGVPVLLLAVSAAACLIPAWRATRIAPTTALRAE